MAEKKQSEDKASEKQELNIEELKKELEDCKKKRDEYLAGWQRARADLVNYKKEEKDRINQLSSYFNNDLILKLLPILDSLNLAENKIPEELREDENIKGLLQIKIQVQDFLKNQGVKRIETLEEKFDPNFHEVVGEIEAKDRDKGIIVEEVQRGYLLNDKVLRPAKVKISK